MPWRTFWCEIKKDVNSKILFSCTSYTKQCTSCRFFISNNYLNYINTMYIASCVSDTGGGGGGGRNVWKWKISKIIEILKKHENSWKSSKISKIIKNLENSQIFQISKFSDFKFSDFKHFRFQISKIQIFKWISDEFWVFDGLFWLMCT